MRKTYKNLLFDWDGTVCNSGRGIIEAVRYAAEKLDRPEMPEERLREFIGPPLKDSFTSVYGMNDADIQKAIEFFREKYRGETLYHAELYTGIKDLLTELSNRYTLYVATSKPEELAKKLADYFGVSQYFCEICGSYSDTQRTKKDEVIQYLLQKHGLHSEDCLMIGDKSHDVIGAKKCGIDCAGVLWGYGSKEELENSKAAYLVNQPSDLIALLIP